MGSKKFKIAYFTPSRYSYPEYGIEWLLRYGLVTSSSKTKSRKNVSFFNMSAEAISGSGIPEVKKLDILSII